MSFLSKLFNTTPLPVFQVNDYTKLEQAMEVNELYDLLADLLHDLTDVENENRRLEQMEEANSRFIDELIDETCEQDVKIEELENKNEALAYALGEVAQNALQTLLFLGYDIDIAVVEEDEE